MEDPMLATINNYVVPFKTVVFKIKNGFIKIDNDHAKIISRSVDDVVKYRDILLSTIKKKTVLTWYGAAAIQYEACETVEALSGILIGALKLCILNLKKYLTVKDYEDHFKK